MNPGVSHLSAMPRLRMLLTVGEITLSGEARPLDTTSGRGPAFVGYAKKWIQACAIAQRLMEANGSADLFETHALDVRIPGAMRGGLAATALNSVLIATASLGMRGLLHIFTKALDRTDRGLFGAPWTLGASATLYNALAPLSGEPCVVPTRVQTESRSRSSDEDAEQTFQTKSTEKTRAHVVLPSRSQILDARHGLGQATPFWDDQQLAVFIALHEFGHAAQHLNGQKIKDFFGTSLMSQDAQFLFSSIKIFSNERSALSELSQEHFGECYADCFAALAMGGADPHLTCERAAQIYAMREAGSPKVESNYSSHDPSHDTREALLDLQERISDMAGAPSSAAEIHEMCLLCAQAGSMRWMFKLATRDAGDSSRLLWTHAAELVDDPSSHSAKTFYQEHFAEIAQVARANALLAPLSASFDTVPPLGQASQGLAIHILLELHRFAGTPRVELAGTLDNSAPSPSMLSKLFTRRASRASLETPSAAAPIPSI